MQIDLSMKNSNAKLGDVVYSEASGWHYLIVLDRESKEIRYRAVCLEEAESTDSFGTIDELIIKHFDVNRIDVISGDELILIRK